MSGRHPTPFRKQTPTQQRASHARDHRTIKEKKTIMEEAKRKREQEQQGK